MDGVHMPRQGLQRGRPLAAKSHRALIPGKRELHRGGATHLAKGEGEHGGKEFLPMLRRAGRGTGNTQKKIRKKKGESKKRKGKENHLGRKKKKQEQEKLRRGGKKPFAPHLTSLQTKAICVLHACSVTQVTIRQDGCPRCPALYPQA